LSETAAASVLGPKLAAAVMVMLSVFAIVGYSSYQVSATDYIVTVTVKNQTPWTASVDNVTLSAHDASSGSLLLTAKGTDLPLVLKPGETGNVTLAVWESPSVASLPQSEIIHVAGTVSYSVGFLHPSIGIDGDYTVAQIEQVAGAAP
jgi:hypothetical protein